MLSIGIIISNGTTTLDNATNSQAYLKDLTDNFKEYTRPRLPESICKKERTLKNVNDVFTGRQWIINDVESGIVPFKGVNVNDDDDNNIYDDELYPKGIQTPRTQGTLRT